MTPGTDMLNARRFAHGDGANVLEREDRRDRAKSLTAENETLKATVAELRQQLSALEELAHTDTLVPLPNRRAFERDLQRVIASVTRYEHEAAVLFVDLDGLKGINDRHGHATGDAVLTHVASALTGSLRASDAVARIGGDEFCMILCHLGEEDARAKVQGLVFAISNGSIEIGTARLKVGVTAGLAMVRPGDTPMSVLSRADKAMYAQRSAR